MLISPGKGPCRHHRFARGFAHCHCKQWVPDRLIGVNSFRHKLNTLKKCEVQCCYHSIFQYIQPPPGSSSIQIQWSCDQRTVGPHQVSRVLTYSFGADLPFKLWVFIILHCLKAGFVPCPVDNWWFLNKPPGSVKRVDDFYWTLGDKLQWNLNEDTKLFIHENAIDIIFRKMYSILFKP